MSSSSSIWFNAHHAPVGAFASFTLGYPGASGGLGLELEGPANENVYLGLQSRDGATFQTLPFHAEAAGESKRYDVSADSAEVPGQPRVHHFAESGIDREFNLGTDRWRAGDLSFTVYTPHHAVPDPATAGAEELKAALLPAIVAELEVDNREGTQPRLFFLGYAGRDPRAHLRRLDAPRTGLALGNLTCLATDDPGLDASLGFTLEDCLAHAGTSNRAFGLGGSGILYGTVPAGERRVARFVIGFHRAGPVTSGLDCRYLYTRWFPSLESVADYALARFTAQKEAALALDARLDASGLSADRRFMLAHAVRSYYGSTQLLEHEGAPFWVVNEGEYRMMNTFDLTVDHLFFELDRNPWVVRNQLDWFTRRYSYRDTARLPGSDTEYPGGLSFTHDMGVANVLSRPGYSAYECHGLHGCFSYMTHEQLVNWVCCAVTYSRETGDQAWREANTPVFEACLESLVNRDHPDPLLRDGVMDADSSRCEGGAEITTYDSLDTSLGQARRNLYLAVKTWTAYLGLADVLESELAARQAELCARTILEWQLPDGSFPAILEKGNLSRIIPAIEGLVFPRRWGLLPAESPLVSALKEHFLAVLREGVCLFADGAWKLSSTNDNSWLSKIYLCQHVAETVLDLPADARADAAHRAWLLRRENAYFAWSDQMIAGVAVGSKYYPRGVTAWLWLR